MSRSLKPRSKEGKAALLLRARTAQSQPSVAKCDPQNILCLALGPPHVTREHPGDRLKTFCPQIPFSVLRFSSLLYLAWKVQRRIRLTATGHHVTAAMPTRPAEATLPTLSAWAKIASRAGKPGSGFTRDRNKLVCWHSDLRWLYFSREGNRRAEKHTDS